MCSFTAFNDNCVKEFYTNLTAKQSVCLSVIETELCVPIGRQRNGRHLLVANSYSKIIWFYKNFFRNLMCPNDMNTQWCLEIVFCRLFFIFCWRKSISNGKLNGKRCKYMWNFMVGTSHWSLYFWTMKIAYGNDFYTYFYFVSKLFILVSKTTVKYHTKGHLILYSYKEANKHKNPYSFA